MVSSRLTRSVRIVIQELLCHTILSPFLLTTCDKISTVYNIFLLDDIITLTKAFLPGEGGLSAQMTLKAMPTGASAPGRVAQAGQVEGDEPD
jgi:hypothetical protein